MQRTPCCSSRPRETVSSPKPTSATDLKAPLAICYRCPDTQPQDRNFLPFWAKFYFICKQWWLKMRRRPVYFRRPVRRRVSNVLWWVLSGMAILLFIFVLSKGSRIESRPEITKVKRRSGFRLVSYLFVYWSKLVVWKIPFWLSQLVD